MSPSWYIFWKLRSFVFFMQVIAAAGSDEKCKLAMQRGTQSSVNYHQGSLKEAVMKLVGSDGVNVVIDTVGGDIFPEWALLKPFQTFVFLLALHLFCLCCSLSCRHWHQREQLSEWVERTRSRGKIRKCLNIAKTKYPTGKYPRNDCSLSHWRYQML